jgi:Ca2+-binding EF-hand superfamily protein
MPVKLTEDQINEYIDAFDSMDYDADGYLTKEEICKVTQSLDLCHRTDKLMDIISSLNYNSNRISKMEFLTVSEWVM